MKESRLEEVYRDAGSNLCVNSAEKITRNMLAATTARTNKSGTRGCIVSFQLNISKPVQSLFYMSA